MKNYAEIYEYIDYEGVTDGSGYSIITDGKIHKIAFPINTPEDIIEGMIDALSARFNAVETNNPKFTAEDILDIGSYNMLVSTSKSEEGEDRYEGFDTFEEALDYIKSHYLVDLDLEEDPAAYPFVFHSPILFDENGEKQVKPVTAAALAECPPATQDIALNLKNRKNAIDTAMYGPLNPAEPNEEYWTAVAAEWNVDAETAKKQRCGNCAVFVVTTEMKNCISQGLTGETQSDEFDAIDAAGELGYCEAFDFKCASARTCRAWVAGGPIDDNKIKE